jgi:tRNA A-37 threonylcarbamoyl transferase component Bud32
LFDSNEVLSDEDKIRLVREIGAGLFHLHKHNIIHRDLAARNILLTSNRHPKISVIFVFFSLFQIIDDCFLDARLLRFIN